MVQPLVDCVRREYSGLAAKEYVAHISRYHRIQASPGYRQAALYVAEELRRWGLAVTIHQYPARFDQFYWSAGMFQEWDCQTATLHLIAPEAQAQKLADFREVPISVIQRSIAAEGDYTVVAVEGGVKREDYQGLDVQGKLVLTNSAVDAVRRIAVEELGAVGVLFDGMNPNPPNRQPGDLQDVRQYTSWWWSGHEKQSFGFALTPRQGAWLRGLLKQGEVRVRARVDARLYDGEIEVIDASLPGETNDEVVITSHLCHPAPGANDNGSGAAANMEAARTLATLVRRGDLPRPRHTVRFLWMPEMTGTYAYLAANADRLPRMVAGINLDMVGADQDAVGSVMLIDSPPEAAASFTLDLLERLRDEFSRDTTSFSSLGGYALFRYATVPFSGGSDHYILSDPTVGVPSPMIIEWPDRYYHTSHDSLEKVSPTTLARNGGLAAVYAYWLAAAGPNEAHWLGEEMLSRAKTRILAQIRRDLTPQPSFSALRTSSSLRGKGEPEKSSTPPLPGEGTGERSLAARLAYRVDREQTALATLQRLSNDTPIDAWRDEIKRFAEQEGKVRLDHQMATGATDRPTLARVPRRRYPGPIDYRAHAHKLNAEDRARLQKATGMRVGPTLALYWTDGRRSIADIAHCLAMETGQATPADDLAELFDLLHKMELVDISD